MSSSASSSPVKKPPPHKTNASASASAATSTAPLSTHEIRIRSELSQLLLDIKRIGPTYPPPQPRCLFSELFDDDSVQNFYEALVGTLKCAKKRGLVRFDGQVLLRGMHDDVVISIVGEGCPPPMRLRDDGLLEQTGEDGGGGGGGGSLGVERSPTKGRRWSKDRAIQAQRAAAGGGLSPSGRRFSPVAVSGRANVVGAQPGISRAGPPSVPPLGIGTTSGASAAKPPAVAAANAAIKASSSSAKTTSSNRPTFQRLHSLPAIQTSASDDNVASTTAGTGPDAPVTATAARLTSPTSQTATAGIVFKHATGVTPAKARDYGSYSRKSSSSAELAASVTQRIESEIERLPHDIARIGTASGTTFGYTPEGEIVQSPRCTFGQLFDDEHVQNSYEALVGTLKSAKKRGVVTFKGQMLLKGMHDDVMIEVVDQDDRKKKEEEEGKEEKEKEEKDRQQQQDGVTGGMDQLKVGGDGEGEQGRAGTNNNNENAGESKAAGEVTREA